MTRHPRSSVLRIGAVVLALSAYPLALAQTSGLVDTKPSCWPTGATTPLGTGGYLNPPGPYSNRYVQGPDALRLDNGDFVILVNNGAPTAPYGSEGLMALRYPSDGSERPRWYPIYATNAWTGATSDGYPIQGSLHEHEDAFPVSRFVNGMWRTLSTTTVDTSFWPCDPYDSTIQCTLDRHREARIDSPLPYLQPVSRDQWWLQPITSNCRNNGVPPLNTSRTAPNSNWDAYDWQQTGACPHIGSGFANAAFGIGSSSQNFYVYHLDGNYTPSPGICDSGILRHLVNQSDFSYSLAGCLAFYTDTSHNTVAPTPNIYDIGVGTLPNTQTPAVFILGAGDIWGTSVDEWYSTDGLTFQKSGQQPVSSFNCSAVGFPETPTTPSGAPPVPTSKNCFVTDLSYLKDKTGALVTPRVLIGIAGGLWGWPGPPYRARNMNPLDPPFAGYGQGNPGDANNWRLFYWADAGATLPPNWAAPAASCPAPGIVQGGQPSYQGNLDSNVSGRNSGGSYPGEYLTGWAWDWYQPNGAINIDVYNGSSYIGTTQAGQYSPSLIGYAAANYPDYTFGNGYHAYSFPVPHSLVDGAAHTLTVKFGGTQSVISNGVTTFQYSPNYQGDQDWTDCFTVAGWIWDSVQPHTPINVDIYDGTTLLGSMSANQYRADLEMVLGTGMGSHGFVYQLPTNVRNGQTHTIYVRYGGTQIATSNSPQQVNCALSFFTVSPCRVYDSRTGGNRLGANELRVIQVSGLCGVPTNARAVSLNFTIAGPTVTSGSLNLDAEPTGIATTGGTTAATTRDGVTRATFSIRPLGINGQLSLQTSAAAGSSCDVVLDVSGYFAH
jgi:hypothetical protein